jgi:hypothetical protein
MMKHTFISGGAVLALALTGLIGGGCSKSSSTGPSTGGVGSVVTVTGRVVGQNGQAVASAPVVVTGKASTNSDASGNFSIANVTTPYDISVVDATNKRALVYKGLTRTDPTLLFVGSSPGTSRTGSVSGKISGGTFTPNQGASDITRVVFASGETNNNTSTAASGTFGPFSLSWFGPTATTGSLYALQFTSDAGGLPVAAGYKGYGVRSGIAVNDGSSLTNQFDTLQTVSTNQFTGTVTVPSGYTLGAKVVYTRVSQSAVIGMFAESNANANLSYYTPGISGATLLLEAIATKAGGGTEVFWKTGLATAATGVSITLVAPPEVSLPVNAATGVDTTVTFSWTAMTGGVHLVVFQGAGSTPTYYVLTSGTSATIPNMKPFGLGLPASTSYSWFVFGFGPFGSVDAAAGSAGFITALAGVPVAATGDVYYGQTATRTFTTAP